MNTKFKYLVVETYKAKEVNPYWYEDLANIESKYISNVRFNVHKFYDENSLTNFLAKNHSASSRYEVFEIFRELEAILETKTTVKFK